MHAAVGCIRLAQGEPDLRQRAAADFLKREGGTMLSDYPIHPVLLAKDLDAARDFYHGKLGLEILVERPGEAIEFGCGGGTRLAVTRSTTGTADSQTQAGWIVADLEAELAELRRRGVRIEDYDLPDFRTENGIADFGFARMAFIVDPGGNALAIEELRQ
jgi:catechol 2,3-dioxygenase-like lactoylglutathione lyase family enzyme